MLADLATYEDRCQFGFHLTAQHPQLCQCQGEALKAEGIARATANAPRADRDRIDAAIRQVAARGGEFSANDVRPLIGSITGPLVGARFNAAARAGLIVHIGYVKSAKASTHAHEVKLWRAA